MIFFSSDRFLFVCAAGGKETKYYGTYLWPGRKKIMELFMPEYGQGKTAAGL